MPQPDPVIVFDGVCVLCNGWVRFLLKRRRADGYRFAAMQGSTGRALLQEHGLDPDDPVSMLLVVDGKAMSDTDAILGIVTSLGGAWRLAALARVVPRPIRDAVYRWIARNRYRWFGRYDQCAVPAPGVAARFLP
jgi:predicted DCC family thiol-disulfide oxidoreductase YuxK